MLLFDRMDREKRDIPVSCCYLYTSLAWPGPYIPCAETRWDVPRTGASKKITIRHAAVKTDASVRRIGKDPELHVRGMGISWISPPVRAFDEISEGSLSSWQAEAIRRQ